MRLLGGMVVVMALASGCMASAPDSSADPAPAGGKAGDGSSTTDPSTGGGSRTPAGDGTDTPPGAATVAGPVGLVVIDVQKVFFDTAVSRNPTKTNPTQLQTNMARAFQLAGQNKIPAFLTFEATMSGDHALPTTLATAAPQASPKEIIKTTFAATSQPEFLPDLTAAGVKRIVVLGAETDVCVLQTTLGLRRAGYDVYAVTDGLFTEEVDDGPALRRYRQAGINTITMADAETILSTSGPTPGASTAAPPVIVKPLNFGFVLDDLGGLGVSDPNSSPKLVRLRELILISEWFKIPVLASDPAAATAALPSNLKNLMTRPILALSAMPAGVKQVAVAGGHANVAALTAELQKSVDVFLLEDVLLGATSAELEPLIVGGAVPSTYKTLYYELTQSVDDGGWPSQQWVTDGEAKYYDETMGMEQLPPLTTPL